MSAPRKDIENIINALSENKGNFGFLIDIYADFRGVEKIYTTETSKPLFPDVVEKKTYSYKELMEKAVEILSQIYPEDVINRYKSFLENNIDSDNRTSKVGYAFFVESPPGVAKTMSVKLSKNANTIKNLITLLHESAHYIHNAEQKNIDWISGSELHRATVEIPSYMHESLMQQDPLFETGSSKLSTEISAKEKANILVSNLNRFDSAVKFFGLVQTTLTIYDGKKPWTVETASEVFKKEVRGNLEGRKAKFPEGSEYDWMRTGHVANRPAIMSTHALGMLLSPMLAYKIRTKDISKEDWIETLKKGGTIDSDEFVQSLGFKDLNEAITKAIKYSVEMKEELEKTIKEINGAVNPDTGSKKTK